jgi:nucleotide-binding universal stress UspA family protein
MFKNILVPTDFTEKSRESIEIAIKMASALAGKCNVTLLHVIEIIEGASYEEFESFYEKLRRRSEKKMDEMISLFSRQGVKLAKKILLGNRVKEILNFIDENGVDLVVLSSHKVDPKEGLQAWGTISYKVGMLAHCPVLMVK